MDTYVCAPLIQGDEPEYVQRDVTLTSLLTPFVGPEMQGWIKTSKDPYPGALEPCGFPSPSVWDGPSDLLLINKIQHNGWDVSTEIRLQRLVLALLPSEGSPLPCCELPCGDTPWPGGDVSGHQPARTWGLLTARKVSLEVDLPQGSAGMTEALAHTAALGKALRPGPPSS